MRSNIYRKMSLLLLAALLLPAPAAFSGEAPPAGSIEKFLGDLESPDRQVRISAMQELGRSRDGRAIHALAGIAGNADEDWRMRIKAIRLLAEAGDPNAVDSLMTAAVDFCPAIRWNAVSALGVFQGNYRVVSSLIAALDDGDLYIREAAVKSLGEAGDPKAVLPLISVLGDKNFVVRITAVRALRKIGDPQAVPFLKRTAQEDRDPLIRGEADIAITALAPGGK